MGNVRRRGLAVLLHHQFPEIESVQEIEKVIALFEKVDLEHNGRVDKAEFKVLLEELRKSGAATVAGSADKMLVDLVFSALDKDDSGDLNLEEILAGYHTLFADERMELAHLLSPSFPSLSEKQILDILKLFERFDDNGNGIIDKHEFYQLKQELAPSIVEVLQQIMKEKNGPLVESDFLLAYQRIFGSRSDASAVTAAAAALTSALSDPCQATKPPSDDDSSAMISSSPAPATPTHQPAPAPEPIAPAKPAELPTPSAQTNQPSPPASMRPLPTPPIATSAPQPTSPSLASSPAPVSPSPSSLASEPQEPLTASSPKPVQPAPSQSASLTPQQNTSTPAAGADAVPAESSNRAAGPSQLWDSFVACDEPLEARRIWTELKSACGADPSGTSSSSYEAVRNRLMCLPRWKPFFQLLDKKRKQKEYVLNSKEQPHVFIVGAGPGGMRTAIEALLLGSRVTLVEMRKRFTRHNLLHIWNSSIRDLRNIGAKFLYPQFCTGGINHVAIRRLQLVLLKVALLLGLNYYRASYAGSQAPTDPASNPLWKANVNSKESINEDDLLFNVLVGADGERSCLANEFSFERKLFKGSDAIGITANFVNTQTPEEKQLDEFGLLSIYNQQFFNELKAKSDIELENLVYYRNETHYFVMTAKRTSLLRKEVLRQDGSLETILNRENVDCSKLEQFVREVADHISLPAHCEFMKNSRGGNDVAIFDFSKKQQATSPSKIVTEGQAKLLVAIVGDALVEPFWPQGTGANRAILGALDTAWMIKTLFERGGTPEQDQKLLDEWVAEFKVMVSSSPDDLQGNLGAWSIDPSTRYKKTSVTHFM